MKIKIHIIYENELRVYLKFFLAKIQLIPDTDKRFDFSKLVSKKKLYPTELISDIKGAQSSSDSIIDKLNSVREIISVIFSKFHRKLNVKLTKIHIRVATGDAAQTAVLYGAVSTAVACIIDLIDDITKLKPIKNSSVSVEPDFLSEKSVIKLNIMLYTSVFSVIKILMKSFINYYSSKNKSQINNRKENKDG